MYSLGLPSAGTDVTVYRQIHGEVNEDHKKWKWLSRRKVEQEKALLISKHHEIQSRPTNQSLNEFVYSPNKSAWVFRNTVNKSNNSDQKLVQMIHYLFYWILNE